MSELKKLQDIVGEMTADELVPVEAIAARVPDTIQSATDEDSEGQIISQPEQIQMIEVEKNAKPVVLPRFITFSLYLIYIIAAEFITTSPLFPPELGLIMYCILLVGLFVHYSLSSDRKTRCMLAVLTFAPLIRILGLSIPLKNYPVLLRYLLIGAPLLFSALLVTWYLNLHPSDIGVSLSKRWFLQLPIAFSGILLGYVEFQILQPAPFIEAPSLTQAGLLALLLLIFVGLLEEYVFRGLMQTAFVEGFGKLGGILYIAILYTVLNLGYHSTLNLFFVFAASLFFGWAALKTRSILGVSLAHGLVSICTFLIFPFLR